jgi:hypothetical protein
MGWLGTNRLDDLLCRQARRVAYVVRATPLLVTLVLVGCANVNDADVNPPPGAIKVEPGLYMVPVQQHDADCAAYAQWSASRPVNMALHYRQPDGTFSITKPDTCAPAGDQKQE